MTNVFIIAGAEFSGRYKLAMELGKIGADIVNASMLRCYKDIRFINGLYERIYGHEISYRHYEFLEPGQSVLPPADYGKIIRKLIKSKWHDRVIIEGSTQRYIKTLLKLTVPENIVGINLPPPEILENRIMHRINVHLDDMINEANASSVSAFPALFNILTDRPRERIPELLGIYTRHATRQQEYLKKIPEIKWMPAVYFPVDDNCPLEATGLKVKTVTHFSPYAGVSGYSPWPSGQTPGSSNCSIDMV